RPGPECSDCTASGGRRPTTDPSRFTLPIQYDATASHAGSHAAWQAAQGTSEAASPPTPPSGPAGATPPSSPRAPRPTWAGTGAAAAAAAPVDGPGSPEGRA